LESVGVEYGIDWVVDHFLEVEIKPEWDTESEAEDWFEEQLDAIYGDQISICGYNYSPGHALRRLDPVAFRQAFLDHMDSLDKDGEMFEHKNGKYYTVYNLEEWIKENESVEEEV
jgi:hypothetical protein